MSIFENKNIKPMLLSELNKPFNDKDYIFEVKFDGMRALIYASLDEILIINRRGNYLNNKFPELNQIKKIVKNKVIFDGEIIVMENGKPSFEKLQERIHLKDKYRIEFFSKENP